MSNTERVRDFIAKWNARDLEGILAAFADNAVYHNIPMEKLTGHEAIRGALEGFVGMASEIKWDLLVVAENSDGSVLTERVDGFLINGKWMSLPVMGTFEFSDGKITAWRDYFDLKDFEAQMAKVSA